MRAGGLAASLLLVKVFALAGQPTQLSVLSVIAYAWQDLAVAIAFWAIDAGLRRPRWLGIPYAVITAWVVINIPVIATLGSALTPTMIRAAGSALSNSMQSALTLAVLLKMCAVTAVALAAPRLLRGLPRGVRRLAVPAALFVAVAGAATGTSVDTNGMHRNALTALLVTAAPRVGSSATDASAIDFRISPFGERRGEDLTQYRGRARGFNVVLVALESTAARYLAPYGAMDDPTPSLTALARESIVFDAAYAAYPESVKGLFSLLCSMAPALDVPAELQARAPCDSVVTRLGQSGYRTGLFHAGRFTYLGMQEIIDVHRFDAKEDAGTISGRVESSFGVDEPAVVSRVLTWIDEGPRDRPFLVTYLPAAGHHPYASAADGPFAMDTPLGVYKNAIYEGDRSLGTLVDGLRARGLSDRTLIVVFGDHGEAFDQHPGNRAHSLYIYDENVHVPLVIRLPGQPSTSGTRVTRVASVLDIGPTILDLTGATPQQGIQGGSLLEPRQRMALFHADYDRAWLGLRDGCWKFVLEVDANRSRLFDVCSDADETRDVAHTDPRRVDAYRVRVKEWAAARRATVLAAAQAR